MPLIHISAERRVENNLRIVRLMRSVIYNVSARQHQVLGDEGSCSILNAASWADADDCSYESMRQGGHLIGWDSVHVLSANAACFIVEAFVLDLRLEKVFMVDCSYLRIWIRRMRVSFCARRLTVLSGWLGVAATH